MATLAHNVAAHVKALRENRSWSQEELAEAAGLSRDAISRIERGNRAPTLATLEVIASAIGVDVAVLIGATSRPARAPRQAKDRRMQSIAQALSSLEPWLAEAITAAVRLISRAQARARRRK